MTGNKFSIENIKEKEPEFFGICEALVLGRWHRFMRGFDPKDYAPGTGLSCTYPILRATDFVFMTGWDGICFAQPAVATIGSFVVELIGDEVKEAGLILGWTFGDSGQFSCALLICTDDRDRYFSSVDRLQEPYLIQP